MADSRPFTSCVSYYFKLTCDFYPYVWKNLKKKIILRYVNDIKGDLQFLILFEKLSILFSNFGAQLYPPPPHTPS